ncbi:angiopoietin-1-like [Asterias rubens]|uniref:angiopoietin-1-like n=1 Tax=Asterias rubens TaxID=7604 RepID=UPI001455A3B9|nr:angiopoietin-1-like [Asterias rubens]
MTDHTTHNQEVVSPSMEFTIMNDITTHQEVVSRSMEGTTSTEHTTRQEVISPSLEFTTMNDLTTHQEVVSRSLEGTTSTEHTTRQEVISPSLEFTTMNDFTTHQEVVSRSLEGTTSTEHTTRQEVISPSLEFTTMNDLTTHQEVVSRSLEGTTSTEHTTRQEVISPSLEFTTMNDLTTHQEVVSSSMEGTTLTDQERKSCVSREIVESGVYMIYPNFKPDGIEVYCDMDTAGGGWIVIQRRQDGSENFSRKWTDYKRGFGSLYGEFWLGNDIINQLTAESGWTLRVDMEDWDGGVAWAKYDVFSVMNAPYKLIVVSVERGLNGKGRWARHSTLQSIHIACHNTSLNPSEREWSPSPRVPHVPAVNFNDTPEDFEVVHLKITSLLSECGEKCRVFSRH